MQHLFKLVFVDTDDGVLCFLCTCFNFITLFAVLVSVLSE